MEPVLTGRFISGTPGDADHQECRALRQPGPSGKLWNSVALEPREVYSSTGGVSSSLIRPSSIALTASAVREETPSLRIAACT